MTVAFMTQFASVRWDIQLRFLKFVLTSLYKSISYDNRDLTLWRLTTPIVVYRTANL